MQTAIDIQRVLKEADGTWFHPDNFYSRRAEIDAMYEISAHEGLCLILDVLELALRRMLGQRMGLQEQRQFTVWSAMHADILAHLKSREEAKKMSCPAGGIN